MTFTSKKPRVKVEEEILKDVINALENRTSDISPWRKPWKPDNQGIHQNFLTGHHYTGSNPIILELYMWSKGQDLPLWIGYGQAKEQGWVVKKGSKAARILRPNPFKIDLTNEDGSPKLDKEGNQEFIMKVSFKGATVFNVSDIEGKDQKSQEKLDAKLAEFKNQSIKSARPLKDRCKQALERLMTYSEGLEGGLHHAGDRAFYRSSQDLVNMPRRESFENDEAYLATLAHEFSHSTAHKTRLDLPIGNTFGSKPYALEELRAEFASMLITNRLQISCDTQNHVAYFDSWIKALDGKASNLMKVFSNAVKAADLVVGEQ